MLADYRVTPLPPITDGFRKHIFDTLPFYCKCSPWRLLLWKGRGWRGSLDQVEQGSPEVKLIVCTCLTIWHDNIIAGNAASWDCCWWWRRQFNGNDDVRMMMMMMMMMCTAYLIFVISFTQAFCAVEIFYTQNALLVTKLKFALKQRKLVKRFV